MTRVTLGDLGEVVIGPLAAEEHALILDSWLRSTTWKRRDVVRVVEAGGVLVARDDAGLALGWLAVADGLVAHIYVKQAYRGYGVARALWVVAGSPREAVANPGNRRLKRVLACLTGEGNSR